MEAVLHQEVMAEIMDDNMETVLRTRREVVEDSLKSRLEDTVKNRVEDTVKVPGFGFLDRQLWAGLEPLRRVSGGNLTDEEVCGKLADSWLEERFNSQEGLQEVQESCWPQWEGVVCVPSSRVGHQAVLPCIAHYNGKNGPEFYDTSYNITKNCLATKDPGGLGGSWENYTNYSQGACVPAASDPHSPLLLPPGNILDLDSLLPHIEVGVHAIGLDECRRRSERCVVNHLLHSSTPFKILPALHLLLDVC